MESISGKEPNKIHFFNQPSTYQTLSAEEQLNIEFSLFFQEQVKKSQAHRKLKINELDSGQRSKLLELEADLNMLKNIANDLKCEEKNSESQQQKSKDYINKILQIEQDIYFKYTPFILQPRSVLPQHDDIAISFYIESVLNGYVNRACYENEIKTTLDAELNTLLNFFDFPPSKIADITIPDNESHNYGKNVAFVTLKSEEGDLVKLVYKPRNAQIDDSVIKVFREINSLPSSDKSSSFDLPTYNIYHSKSGNGSIWEFISDVSLRKNYSSNPKTLGGFALDQEEHLQIKASRLDDILSLLHVADQHGENILLKKNKEGQVTDFVPVDLEVVSFPKDEDTPTPTGLQTGSVKSNLSSKGKYLGLTEQEKEIIQKTRKEFPNYNARFVPMWTYRLVQKLTSLSNYSIIAETFVHSIQEEYHAVENLLAILKENIILDYLNNDVPYLTTKNGILYYGSPEKNIILGKMR